jgi:hypothetical protein
MSGHRSDKRDGGFDATSRLEQQLRGLVPRKASCRPDWSEVSARPVARHPNPNWLSLQLMGTELSRWGAAAVLLMLWGLGAAAGGGVAVAWLRQPAPTAPTALGASGQPSFPVAGATLDASNRGLGDVADSLTGRADLAVGRTADAGGLDSTVAAGDWLDPWHRAAAWTSWLAKPACAGEELDRERWRAGSGHRLARGLQTAEHQRVWLTQTTANASRQQSRGSVGSVAAPSEPDSWDVTPTGGSTRQSLLRDLLQPDSDRIL